MNSGVLQTPDTLLAKPVGRLTQGRGSGAVANRTLSLVRCGPPFPGPTCFSSQSHSLLQISGTRLHPSIWAPVWGHASCTRQGMKDLDRAPERIQAHTRVREQREVCKRRNSLHRWSVVSSQRQRVRDPRVQGSQRVIL